jgi:hypothetical protein
MCTNSHAAEVLIKTYPLMGEHGLLHEKKNKSGLPSQWVYIPVENWFFITFGENT